MSQPFPHQRKNFKPCIQNLRPVFFWSMFPSPPPPWLQKLLQFTKLRRFWVLAGGWGSRISSYPSSLRTPWGNLSICAARSNLYILLSNFVSKTQAEESSALGGQESDSTELNKHRKVMSKTATTAAAAAIDEPISKYNLILQKTQSGIKLAYDRQESCPNP